MGKGDGKGNKRWVTGEGNRGREGGREGTGTGYSLWEGNRRGIYGS
jgi:hypothetical protein